MHFLYINLHSLFRILASLSVALTIILPVNDFSILIRSTEWDKIKANMPWLLDAVVCVGLDLFVSSSNSYKFYLYFETLCIHIPHPHTTDISDKHSFSMTHLLLLLLAGLYYPNKFLSLFFVFLMFCLNFEITAFILCLRHDAYDKLCS